MKIFGKQKMKRQITFLSLLALLGAFVFSLVGCGDNPNPCKNLKPVSADFKFQVGFYDLDSLVTVEDTVYMNKVYFIAKEENANYLWTVGDYISNPTKKDFFLIFNQPQGLIKTKLNVTKEPNKACFPNDDGIDSLTRRLFVADPKVQKAGFEGTFTGFNADTPSDVFSISIKNFGDTPNTELSFGMRLYNLPKGCGGPVFTSKEPNIAVGDYTHKVFYIYNNFVNDGPCSLFTGLGRVTKNNSVIEVDYTMYDTNRKLIKRKFVGIRTK